MRERLRHMAQRMKLRRLLTQKAMLLVVDREKKVETAPPPPAPLAPQVVNQSMTLSVASLTVQAKTVSLVVDKLDQRVEVGNVEVGEPQVNLQLSPTINVEAAQVTLPPMQPVIQASKVEVSLPDPPAVPVDFCPPPQKREIVFTRDQHGNIVSAKEV